MLTNIEWTYSIDTSAKEQALEILIDCFQRGGKLLLCGNGGSAADCEHIVGELMKGMNAPREFTGFGYPLQGALPVISLCSQVGLITAIANDMGADYIFAQQVYGYGRKGDALLGISTSGQSQNVLVAMVVAKRVGMKVIGLTGPYTEQFDKYCDAVISAPGLTTQTIQEGHQRIYHELCARLEEEFFT